MKISSLKLRSLKRLLAGIAFAAALTGLAATSSLAAGVPNFRPGCDGSNTSSATDGTGNYGGFFGLQESHANSIRVRDRLYARQVQHQNDNSMGMTCFDHTLALTGHLGQIFSDLHPVTVKSGPGLTMNQPQQNSGAFGVSTFPNYGANQFLVTDLNVLVAPTLSSHAKQFPASISAQLGATQLNFMASFMGPINTIINNILNILNTVQSWVNNLQSAMNFFNQMLNIMGIQPPLFMAAFAAWVGALYTTLKSAIEAVIQGFIATVNGMISGALNAIMMGITSTLTNYAVSNSANNQCSRVQNLWGVQQGFNFPPTMLNGLDVRSLTMAGRQPGLPYFNLVNLFNKNPIGTGSWAGTGGTAGPTLTKELTAGVNSGLLTRALTDKTSNLTTPGAGILQTDGVWPAIPSIPAATITCGSAGSGCNTGNAAALIGLMN
jgi:hypothetical protein